MDSGIKPIVWTSRSIRDLEKITKFYVGVYGLTKTREIITGIRQSTEILERTDPKSSEIGSVDDFFNHLKFTYRKLLNHHCKITYRIGKKNIFIVRVFDMRQNPNKNK